MGYQFAHLETFSRKANAKGQSTDFVFDEASRVPEASRHVEAPKEPVLVYGLSLDELRAEHDRLASEAKTTNVKGQSRAIRKDQHTLVTIILSHPGEGDVEGWQRDSIEWLKERYGGQLRTVIRHDDESHPHLHAYLLDEGMRAKNLHPGAVAKAEVMELDPKANKQGDAAYRAAMRAWQDDYWQSVGIRHGLARLGPGRRRLSRADWQHEQQAVQSVKAAHALAEDMRRATIDDSAKHSAEMNSARNEIERLKAEAMKAVEAAKAEHDRAVEDRSRVRAWYADTKTKLAAFRDKLISERRDIEQERIELDHARAEGSVWRRRILGWFEASPKETMKAARAEVSFEMGLIKADRDRMNYQRIEALQKAEKADRARLDVLGDLSDMRNRLTPDPPKSGPEARRQSRRM